MSVPLRPICASASSMVILLAALLVCPPHTIAKTIYPKPGWLLDQDLPKAFELAKANNKPVAIFFCFRKSFSDDHNNACDNYMATTALNDFVRVLVYVEERESIRQYIAQAKGAGGAIPELYLVEPDGRLAGFVDCNKDQDLRPNVRRVLEITRWRAAVPARVAAADKLAE